MSWNRIIGQKQQVRVLSSALKKGRLAHAYLFSGPEGSGKEMTAFEMAATLNCRAPDAMENGACGTCPDCLQIREFLHPNVEYLFPVEAALLEGGGEQQKKENKKFTEAKERFQTLIEQKKENPYFSPAMDRSMGILTEQVVQLQQKAAFMPREGSRKVFVISQAEKLHPSAANKLLKLLEEPPAHVLFILTTSRPDSLLPTIRSRCQEIRFQRVSQNDLRGWLVRHRPEIAEPELGFIVNFSRGNLRLAWELIAGREESSEPQTIALRQLALDYLRKVLAPKRFHEALTAAEEHARNLSRSELTLFIGAILLFLQDTCHRRLIPDFRNLNNPDIEDAVDRFARNFPNADYLGVSNLAEESIRSIERNASPQLTMAAFTGALRPLLQRA
ncbi:DNA polymerase III subunit delta' [Chlorobium sp. N1]|uniref:DNA polymerase III subunit delta' n=1 Tax=Chlorobium sp. N1 TaxID=2491138 RepID=UPI00103D07C9|nr:DNA polymerase III subunit delta' [Chlorobium sp. N1]TCD48731.1 DNA polymerase III subunit delta' [Chlorobium sp. N1]